MKSFFSICPTVLLVSFLAIFASSCLNGDDPDTSFQDQWVQDTTAIGSYLRTNNITAMTDVSGVRFVIDQLGSGFPPKSSAKVTYTGKLLTNEIFDEGTNVTFNLSNLIPGFQIGLSLFPEGTKGRIYIPSGYAYGETVRNGIPANSNLIFEIELVDAITTTTENNQLASDTVAIDTYLANNSINAIKDPSGLRYVINQTGTGPMANLYNKVKLAYTGKILSSGVVFFEGTNGPSATFDSRVINYIYSFQAGLTKLQAGGKATFYVPSGLGFGSSSTQGTNVTIPANSNLIFEMELVEIVE